MTDLMMPIEFYIAVLIVLIVVPGLMFFGPWWNERHGLNSHGEPHERLSLHGKSDNG